jgi:prevent-host-death family protein
MLTDMAERVMRASDFKAQCLALLDHVAETREVVIVTKRGKPVARLGPLDEGAARPTDRSVELLSDVDADFFTTGVAWDAD